MARSRTLLGTLLALALVFLAWDVGAGALTLPEVSNQQASSESRAESPVILIAAPERAATLNAEGRSASKSLLAHLVPAGLELRGSARADRSLQPGAVFSPPPLHLRHCVFLC